jgi:hypothetical protein
MTNPKYCALFKNYISKSNLLINKLERDCIRQELRGINKRQDNFYKKYLVSKALLKFLKQTKEVLKFAIIYLTEFNNGKVFNAFQKATKLAYKLETLAIELVRYLPYAIKEGLLINNIYKVVLQQIKKINRLLKYL